MDYNLSKLWASCFYKKRGLKKDFFSYLFNVVRKYIIKNRIQSWLDVGCGDGRILIPLALKFSDIKFYGVDKNKTMTENLKIKVENVDIHNIATKNQSIEKFISNKKKFDVISFFQSIHFFNLQKIMKKVDGRLKKDGYVIIATTTHQQFNFIPYSKNVKINKIEKKRTPDWQDIIQELKNRNTILLNERDFTIYKSFNNSKTLRNYLNTIPYSAFSLVSQKECSAIIEDVLEKYTHKRNFKFVIDKFKVGIFKSI